MQTIFIADLRVQVDIVFLFQLVQMLAIGTLQGKQAMLAEVPASVSSNCGTIVLRKLDVLGTPDCINNVVD